MQLIKITLLWIFSFCCLNADAQKHRKNELFPSANDEAGGYNYVNARGKIVICNNSVNRFEEAKAFPETDRHPDSVVAVVWVNNGKRYQFINKKGELIHTPETENYEAVYLNQNCYLVVRNNKIGVLSIFGKTILDCRYSHVFHYQYDKMPGIFPIGMNRKWGAVNSKGETIIPFIYDTVVNIEDQFMTFKKDRTSYLFNSQGKLLYNSGEFTARYPNLGICIIYDKEKYGAINYKGEWVLEPDNKYDYLYTYTDFGYKIIRGVLKGEYPNQKIVLFDTLGKVILQPRYSSISFQSDYFIPCYFDSVTNLKHCALYDSEGKIKLQAAANDLRMEYAWRGYWLIAAKKDSTGSTLEALMRPNGKTLIPFKYEAIDPSYLYFNMVAVKDAKTKKYGATDTTGKIIIDCKFETRLEFIHDRNQTAYTKLDKKNVAINKKGEILFSFADLPNFSHESHGVLVTRKSISGHHNNESNTGIYTLDGKPIVDTGEHRYLAMPSVSGVILCSKQRYWGDLMLADTSGRKLDTVNFDGLSFINGIDRIAACVNCRQIEPYSYRGKHEVYFKGGKAAIVLNLETLLMPRFYQFSLNRKILKLMAREKYTSNGYLIAPHPHTKSKKLERKIKHMKKISMNKFLTIKKNI